ncbi:MAG: hypothetical protein RIQ93_833 [Verrucomicrobiota bacterium]|jgi:hypothetical protein
MNSPETFDTLARVMRAWRLQPPRNPEFRAGVWQRLRAGQPLSWAGYVRAHAAPVAATLALAVAVGALTGREQARARVAAERAELAASYVKALDARSMVMP